MLAFAEIPNYFKTRRYESLSRVAEIKQTDWMLQVLQLGSFNQSECFISEKSS